jgi:hypothetical protein
VGWYFHFWFYNYDDSSDFDGGTCERGAGWSVATATFGYRRLPNKNKRHFDAKELSNLLERHHPMGKLAS